MITVARLNPPTLSVQPPSGSSVSCKQWGGERGEGRGGRGEEGGEGGRRDGSGGGEGEGGERG